jgi:hypothetical protein
MSETIVIEHEKQGIKIGFNEVRSRLLAYNLDFYREGLISKQFKNEA